MNNIKQEMEGIDFDWFAIDQSGNWAVFTTAGEGFIPDIVLKHADLHSSISEKISRPNWGSSNIWHDYEVTGLFAFDWDSTTGLTLKKLHLILQLNLCLTQKIFLHFQFLKLSLMMLLKLR